MDGGSYRWQGVHAWLVAVSILGAIGVIVFVIGKYFHWLLVAIFAVGFAILFYLRRVTLRAPPVSQDEPVGTTVTTSDIPEPKPSQLQTASHEANQEGKTIMRNSPSNHPLAKSGGAFSGTLGFILDILVAAGIFYYACGFGPAPAPTFTFLGLLLPIEVVPALAAWAYFILASLFSVTRDRSPGWASVDLIGTAIVFAVIAIGLLSLAHAVVAAFLINLGLPPVRYNSLTVSMLVFFGIATIVYAYVFHVRRSRVGLEATLSKTEVDQVSEVALHGTAQAFPDGYVVMPIRAGYVIDYIPRAPRAVADAPRAA